jgi:general secretion pathway protein C
MDFNKMVSSRFNEPKKAVAIVIFVIACALFASQVLTFFKAERDVNPVQTLVSNKKSQEIIDSRSALFTKPLFGVYTPGLSDAEIKQSTLDLQIVGIMYSPDNQESQVIIRASGGSEQTYIIGDKLPGGAKIKRISKKGIVVLYNGSLESLSLPQNELLFDEPAKPLIGE